MHDVPSCWQPKQSLPLEPLLVPLLPPLVPLEPLLVPHVCSIVQTAVAQSIFCTPES